MYIYMRIDVRRARVQHQQQKAIRHAPCNRIEKISFISPECHRKRSPLPAAHTLPGQLTSSSTISSPERAKRRQKASCCCLQKIDLPSKRSFRSIVMYSRYLLLMPGQRNDRSPARAWPARQRIDLQHARARGVRGRRRGALPSVTSTHRGRARRRAGAARHQGRRPGRRFGLIDRGQRTPVYRAAMPGFRKRSRQSIDDDDTS